jgi:hypothetical protein
MFILALTGDSDAFLLPNKPTSIDATDWGNGGCQ